MKPMDKMKDKKLMKHIIDEVQEEGVIGEEDSIAILTLKIMLRLVKDAKATGGNILVSDNTGGGKDHLTKNVCKVLLENKKTCYHRTNLSPKIFNYWQPVDANKKPTTWNGKVLYLEDPEEECLKSQAFKVMASGGTSITVVKDQKVFEREIDGKPVIIVTSMKANIDDEGQRRWDCIRVDTSPELTQKVIQKSFDKAEGLIPYNPDEQFRILLRSLRSYDVIIPYASRLHKYFSSNMVLRTQVLKLLDYIRASAILHQYQRKKDADGKLIAEEDDYELARYAFIKLRNAQGNALNKKEEAIVDYLVSKKKPVKLNQVTSDLNGISRNWLYENKDNLVDKNVIITKMEFDPDANRDVEHLQYNLMNNKCNLPSSTTALGKKASGYIASGQFYKEVNQIRKKEGLKKIFTEVRT